MPLILDRKQVLDVYAEARDRAWVIPCFNAENLATIEGVLDAVAGYGQKRGIDNLPITVGITNSYAPRPQALLYSLTRRWNTGIELFLKDLEVLSAPGSPYENLRVMVHLDHAQWDTDAEILAWGPHRFSSIMFDASTLDLETNMKLTAGYVEKHRDAVVIEGACDEISSASTASQNELTGSDDAERYYRATGVDLVVANLGTEHRSSSASLKYEGALAREISRRIGPRLCLHGASSVADGEFEKLFTDGVSKVNIWTILERDSTMVLLRTMLKEAARHAGPDAARAWKSEGLLGPAADTESPRSLPHFAAAYRRDIVAGEAKAIVMKYLTSLYP
jgi:fructose/tagatose bisphosphate aldolase